MDRRCLVEKIARAPLGKRCSLETIQTDPGPATDHRQSHGHAYKTNVESSPNEVGCSWVDRSAEPPSQTSVWPMSLCAEQVHDSECREIAVNESNLRDETALQGKLRMWLTTKLRDDRLESERRHAIILQELEFHFPKSAGPACKSDATSGDMIAALPHIPASSSHEQDQTTMCVLPPLPSYEPPHQVNVAPPVSPAPQMFLPQQALSQGKHVNPKTTTIVDTAITHPNCPDAPSDHLERDVSGRKQRKSLRDVVMPAVANTSNPTGVDENKSYSRRMFDTLQRFLFPPIDSKPKGGDNAFFSQRGSAPEMKGARSCTELNANETWLQSYDRRIQSNVFELIFAFAILLNALQMALLQQYNGDENGHKISFPRYQHTASRKYPHAEEYLTGAEKAFTICFLIELLLRASSYRCNLFRSGWNYLDMFVVSMALLAWIYGAGTLKSPAVMRLARFGKLMRIIRFLKHSSVLESLKLMLASIQASVSTLFWSLCVLLIIQSVAGMVLGQLLADFIKDESKEIEVRRKVFAYFGTYWRSTITMFEILFANWAPSCRVLLDEVSEWYGAFFVIYRCVIGFSVLSVIQAVFIQQTMKSAKIGEDVLLAQKKREQEKYSARLQKVFDELDESGDGFISWEEFVPILQDPHLQAMLMSLEVNVDDIETLFNILDDGDGMISSEEFVKGVTHIRGQAKAIDLISLLNIVKRVEYKMGSLQLDLSHCLANQDATSSIETGSFAYRTAKSTPSKKKGWKGATRALKLVARNGSSEERQT